VVTLALDCCCLELQCRLCDKNLMREVCQALGGHCLEHGALPNLPSSQEFVRRHSASEVYVAFQKARTTLCALQARLMDIRRDMAVCMVTRFRKFQNQVKQLEKLGINPDGILLNMDRSALLKPLFIIVQDPCRETLLIIIRGTTSIRDIFTSLSGTTKPHHVFGSDGVVLGYSHFGMLAAARWIYRQAKSVLEEFLRTHPAWKLRIIGHSLGAGTAVLLCMMCAPVCLFGCLASCLLATSHVLLLATQRRCSQMNNLGTHTAARWWAACHRGIPLIFDWAVKRYQRRAVDGANS
jgi:hypothetical protein